MFTGNDDQELRQLVTTFGEDNWIVIAQQMSHPFTIRQCRDRWRNYLDPNLSHEDWTEADDADLLSAYHQMGNRWASLALLFRGRTSNFVRNRCQALVRKNNKNGQLRTQSQLRGGDRDNQSSQQNIIDFFLGKTIRFQHAVDRDSELTDHSAEQKRDQ
jgi:hypothetical protein